MEEMSTKRSDGPQEVMKEKELSRTHSPPPFEEGKKGGDVTYALHH